MWSGTIKLRDGQFRENLPYLFRSHQISLYKNDLAEYARSINNPDELIGTWVKVKTQNFKGEIVNVVGPLAEHKSRLLDISSDENIQKIIEQAPPEESIVKIQAGQNTYDYVLSALNPILRMGDLHRFGVNSQKAMNAFRLAPDSRNRLVREVAKSHKIRWACSI